MPAPAAAMIGAHILLFSSDPEADRAFLRDVLGFRHVDVGGGWLIFALPPAELAVHPVDGRGGPSRPTDGLSSCALYLMCDDLRSVVTALHTKHIGCGAIQKEDWGMATTITLPSGGVIGLYQPAHPTAVGLD